MATAQNGWPASADKAQIGVNAKFAVAGVTFPGGIKAGDVETVMRYLFEQFHLRVEPLVAGWCWGWAFRDVRDGEDLSNHAAAAAGDANAPRHPLGKVGTFTAAQVGQIRSILRELDGVVRWGGDYANRKDEMHFEIVGTLAEVAAVAVRLRGRGGQPPVPTGVAPVSATGRPTIRQGSVGPDVAVWQRHLRLHIDGKFGPLTTQATVRYQRDHGLSADGVVGPATWREANS